MSSTYRYRAMRSCALVLALAPAAWLGAAACTSSSGGGVPVSTDGGGGGADGAVGLGKIDHVVVIVLENWSFDSLYAELAGAEGLANAMKAPPQVDATGAPYATLPQSETHLPQTLPNAPFALDDLIPASVQTSTDLTNNFYEEQ